MRSRRPHQPNVAVATSFGSKVSDTLPTVRYGFLEHHHRDQSACAMDCPLDQCVTEAANEPTSESLRSLNHLMKSHGVELNLFQDVSSEKLLLLQDRTSHVLKRTTEPTTSLLCLATLARLAKLPNGTMLMTGDEAAPSVDIYATARSFFTGKRAVKTLGLVILNAILSCKEDSPSATDEPLESRPLIKENLSLIKDIIDAVDHAQKNEWAQSHGATIRKLYDKLSGHTLSLPNRLKGAEIVLSLPGAEREYHMPGAP